MVNPVFFTPHMVADSGSYSPSAAKPAAVVDSWRAAGFEIDVVVPAPLSVPELSLAHDRRMVEEILAGRRDNGFGNRSRDVAATLPFTSGAMYAAATRALENRRVAAAACSGFHHAGWSEPGGFCTFNGLVVTARLLRARHGVKRVGILDFDEHYGNGTDDIIRRMKLDWVVHHTAGRYGHRPEDSERFLAGIPEIISGMKRAGCDLVLYQAGADMHVDDPLGGFLTTEQLLRRDTASFEACRSEGLPIAWNLAGGYQRSGDGIRPVLDIHDNTMRSCLQVFGRRPTVRPGDSLNGPSSC